MTEEKNKTCGNCKRYVDQGYHGYCKKYKLTTFAECINPCHKWKKN